MLKHRQNVSIKYFAEFLSEIGAIIQNIRNYVHQIIEISAPIGKTQVVKQSISNVIVSTSKTFNDLKAIESLIAGYARAHRLKVEKRSLSESHSTHFQSYENSKHSSAVRKWFKNRHIQQQIDSTLRANSKTRNHNTFSHALWKQKQDNRKGYILDSPPKYTANNNNSRVQTNTQEIIPQKQNSWLNKVQLMLGSLIQSNRQNLQRIIQQSQQCRREITTLKAQLVQNC